MSRIVNRNATSLILTLRLADAADDPVNSIAYNNGSLAVAWINSASTDWTTETLASGTAGTYVENGWIFIANGIYQYCLPNDAIAAGDRTQIRVTYSSNPPQYDSIDAVIYIPDDIATSVANALRSVRLQLQQQLTLDGTTSLNVIQGDDYTRAGVRIDLVTDTLDDPDMDLSSYKLVIAANTQSAADKIIVRMDILGAAGSHYVVFNPPSSITEDWPTGVYNLLYRIEWAENEYQTIDANGILTVDPFDISEADIVDLDPPA